MKIQNQNIKNVKRYLNIKTNYKKRIIHNNKKITKNNDINMKNKNKSTITFFKKFLTYYIYI